jgi:hypothetical protein
VRHATLVLFDAATLQLAERVAADFAVRPAVE